MHPTPIIPKFDPSLVYDPAEDSFLLLDAIEADLSTIEKTQPRICMEIGSGSGCVITFLAQVLKKLSMSPLFIATDINSHSCKATQRTLAHNRISHSAVINTTLAQSLEHSLYSSVDVLLFNPPYVPTDTDCEPEKTPLSAAWAGGDRGTENIDKVIKTATALLSKRGVFYLVVLEQNGLDRVRAMYRKEGFESETILSRRAGSESLHVVRFRKQKTKAPL
ncbi:MAG: protein methyltransferase Mtq2 [Amphiamblys sp. WSBS2006]|nr:MAG: protein methyltransferase Mtq2 [Amphiamblys sp. WSBS2006]